MKSNSFFLTLIITLVSALFWSNTPYIPYRTGMNEHRMELNSFTSADALGAPQPGDLVINEILSNPKPGGIDFLEIYNHSDKPVDLSGIRVARVGANGAAGGQRVISRYPLFIYPNEYKVLTRKPSVIKEQYPRATSYALLEMTDLPDFNNETGGVVIYSERGVIDSLFYSPAMLSPFMISNRGVSLERQHFSTPTHAPGNFRPAAVVAGGATPGYRNSQYLEEHTREDVFLSSKTFSPDGDGFEDQLEINYRLSESGFMMNIDIYTEQGQLIRRLVRNQSAATHGTIYWDGRSDTNVRLPLGLYVAVVEVYNSNGVRKMYRKAFVLAARL